MTLDLLDEYREKIQSNTEAKLGAYQKNLNDSIDTLAVQFQDQINLLSGTEKPVLSTVVGEKLRVAIVQQSPRKAEDQQYEIVSLHDRILDFENYVTEKQQLIGKLTNEWNETQMSIICLAIEILGVDALEVGEEGVPVSMEMAIMKAAAKSNNSIQQHEAVLAKIKDIEGRIKELTQQTKQTIAEQQEVRTVSYPKSPANQSQTLKLNQKRQLNALRKGLKTLLENA